jgi:hypothetical protein
MRESTKFNYSVGKKSENRTESLNNFGLRGKFVGCVTDHVEFFSIFIEIL